MKLKASIAAVVAITEARRRYRHRERGSRVAAEDQIAGHRLAGEDLDAFDYMADDVARLAPLIQGIGGKP